MLLFFQCNWPMPFLLFFHCFGCIFFFMEIIFCPNLFLHLVYRWVWCSMRSLMFILILILVFHEALCESVLACTILVGQLNKIFGFIILHGLYCMVFKNICFWCDTKSNIAPGLRGDSNQISCLSDIIIGWFNFCKNHKAPSRWRRSFSCVMHTCLTFLLVT